MTPKEWQCETTLTIVRTSSAASLSLHQSILTCFWTKDDAQLLHASDWVHSFCMHMVTLLVFLERASRGLAKMRCTAGSHVCAARECLMHHSDNTCSVPVAQYGQTVLHRHTAPSPAGSIDLSIHALSEPVFALQTQPNASGMFCQETSCQQLLQDLLCSVTV